MAALFPRWSNGVYRLTAALFATLVLGSLIGLMLYVRTPWNTSQLEAVDQPVEFDHRHHVFDDQIDCLYCHGGAEVSAHAGVPATDVCMGCHGQIYNESPLLEPVRRSYFSGKPIPWNRVHDLPDFAYFNHAVHVQSGVGCVRCHGRVDQMARVYKVVSLSMGFCLDCHAQADAFSRAAAARSVPTSNALFGVEPPALQRGSFLGPRQVDALTTCSACHR